MSERDRTIGQTLVILRGAMSQQSVANAMRERGHKWAQATVWSVETGERPLRMAEAEDLATVLGVRVAVFHSEPVEATLEHWIRQAQAAYNAITAESLRYLDCQEQITSALESASEQGVSLLGPKRKGGGWLEATPENAVEAARFKYDQQERSDAGYEQRQGGEFKNGE